MKPRTLLVLLLLVAGLGAFVWFVERDLPGSEERAEQAKKVLALERLEIDAVTIERDGARVRLEVEPRAEADGGPPDEEAPLAQRRWRLVEPFAAAADGGQVRQLLDTLVGLDKQRTLDEYDAAELGLDAPRARVRLRTAAGERVLAVGVPVPSSSSMIVAEEGKKRAYVVADGLWADLAREPGDWRDKNLFAGERADIRSIRLHPSEGEELLIARRGDGFWLESPLADRADRDRGDRLVSDLVNLRATRFLDETPAAELGLEPPAGWIEVVLEGREQPFRVAVATAAEEAPAAYAVRAGGQLAEVATDLGRWLGTTADDWRSLSLTGLDSWEIDGATVTDARGELVLARTGTEWTRNGDTIAFTPVSDLFAAVAEAEAARLLPAGAAGAGKPVLTLALTGSGGDKESIRLYAASGEGVPARAEGREATLLLPAEEARQIRDAVAAVRAATSLARAAEVPDDIAIEIEEGGDDG